MAIFEVHEYIYLYNRFFLLVRPASIIPLLIPKLDRPIRYRKQFVIFHAYVSANKIWEYGKAFYHFGRIVLWVFSHPMLRTRPRFLYVRTQPLSFMPSRQFINRKIQHPFGGCNPNTKNKLSLRLLVSEWGLMGHSGWFVCSAAAGGGEIICRFIILIRKTTKGTRIMGSFPIFMAGFNRTW